MDISGLLIMFVTALPALGAYVCLYFLRFVNNKRNVKLIIMTCSVLVYLLMMSLGILVKSYDTLMAKIFWLNLIYIGMVTMTFPFVHKNFRNAYNGLEENISKHPVIHGYPSLSQ